jgi:hypothetical protein
MNWIDLTEDRDKWEDVVNMVVPDFLGSLKCGKFYDCLRN